MASAISSSSSFAASVELHLLPEGALLIPLANGDFRRHHSIEYTVIGEIRLVLLSGRRYATIVSVIVSAIVSAINMLGRECSLVKWQPMKDISEESCPT